MPEGGGEGVATKERLSEAKPLWREGGSDSRGKRVRGGERSERDGHRCKYRQHRRHLNTSPEARGLPQSEGHYRSYSLYSPPSMPLIFWQCLSVCFALYHIVVIIILIIIIFVFQISRCQTAP